MLSILIISYNTKELVLACIDSVLTPTQNRFELIVVDNASHDGSAAAIRFRFGHLLGRNLRLIELDQNLGFARGNNRAAAEASPDSDYLLLLNPDTEVRAHAIDELLAFAKSRPQAGIWGGRTIYADGRLNPTSCWRRMSVWSLICCASGLSRILAGVDIFNREAYGGWQRDNEREVDIVSGCFFLIRRSVWEELGGFDERFFMYGEEADLCFRARRLGYRPAVTPRATIVHHGGGSQEGRVRKLVGVLKAKTTLVRRHWSPAFVWIGASLLAAWPLTRLLSLSAMRWMGMGDADPRVWRDVWRQRRSWMHGYDE